MSAVAALGLARCRVVAAADATRVGSATTNRENHRRNTEWLKALGVADENILELGRIGNCHHLAVEKALALPGSVYFSAMTDGHAITVGGVGCFGSCMSASAPAFLRTGWTWFRVPESIKFNITGKLQDGVMGRDVVVKLSTAWGGLRKHKPLVEAALNWLNVASPKLIPPEDRLPMGGGLI